MQEIEAIKLIHGICLLSGERDDALTRLLSTEDELNEVRGSIEAIKTKAYWEGYANGKQSKKEKKK